MPRQVYFLRVQMPTLLRWPDALPCFHRESTAAAPAACEAPISPSLTAFLCPPPEETRLRAPTATRAAFTSRQGYDAAVRNLASEKVSSLTRDPLLSRYG